jgi:hypothetical protein
MILQTILAVCFAGTGVVKLVRRRKELVTTLDRLHASIPVPSLEVAVQHRYMSFYVVRTPVREVPERLNGQCRSGFEGVRCATAVPLQAMCIPRQTGTWLWR